LSLAVGRNRQSALLAALIPLLLHRHAHCLFGLGDPAGTLTDQVQ
jgi:hypothetical protein